MTGTTKPSKLLPGDVVVLWPRASVTGKAVGLILSDESKTGDGFTYYLVLECHWRSEDRKLETKTIRMLCLPEWAEKIGDIRETEEWKEFIGDVS